MRILQLSYVYHPFLQMGGPAGKVKAIAERLVERGHEVTVVTSNHGSRRSRSETIAGVDVLYLGSYGSYRSATLNPGIVEFCRRRLGAFDAAHIYGLYDLLGPAGASYCRRLGVGYVVEPLGMHRPIVRSLLKKRIYHRTLGRAFIDGAAFVVATSEYERQQLIEDGVDDKKVLLRRNGVDLDEFAELPPAGRFRQRWRVPGDAPLTLFLGRLTEKKQPLALLRAFAAIPGEKGFLVFAGPDEDGNRQMLKTEAARLGVADKVVFPGPMYEDQKVEAFVDADVFVLPSVSENFGNAAVEAMACGTPVIVTDQCGVAPDVDGRAGLVIPVGTEELSEALAALIADASLRQRYGAEGPAVARGLYWDMPIARMESVYADLAAPRSALRFGDRD